MINFKNCLVTENSIYIDVRIKPHVFFDNCYINRVVINDIDTFHTTGPNLDACIFDSGELEGDHKKYIEFIKCSEFWKSVRNISKNIYFIYVQIKGLPAMNTPCGNDVEWYSIAIIDYKYIYDRCLHYVRELNHCKCAKPRHFIDFILKFKALEMCLISKEWERAIEFFKEICPSDPCGCGCKEKIHYSGCKKCGCNG